MYTYTKTTKTKRFTRKERLKDLTGSLLIKALTGFELILKQTVLLILILLVQRDL